MSEPGQELYDGYGVPAAGGTPTPPPDDSGTDTDEDGLLIQQATREHQKRQAEAKATKKAPKKPAGAVTLRALMEAGLIHPGEDCLSIEYKGTMTYASLTPDARISWKNLFFESPSAFSIHLKRLVNPNRKADDGWKTVKYNGKFLEAFKLDLLMRQFGGAADGDDSAGGPPAKRARTDASVSGRGSGLRPARGGFGGRGMGGPGGGRGRQLSNNTPRPAEGADMGPEAHDFAPGPDEIRASREAAAADAAAAAAQPYVPCAKHFMSGNDLEGHESSQGEAHLAGSGSTGGASANGRPRRMVKPPSRLTAVHGSGGGHDAHDMVPCEAYRGVPGSGTPGAQPFRVLVAPSAEIVMDFHAHLDRNEVIGLLSGSWDAAARQLRIERAFPVREAVHGNGHIDVEMDPEDQFKVQQVISELHGQRVVGWYHSHPTFPALPSIIDITNQLMSQKSARDEHGNEPYVAAIVSPYDKRLPTLQSVVTWFNVAYDRSRDIDVTADPLDQGCTPMELAIERLLRPNTADTIIRLVAMLKTTAARYGLKRSATNLAAPWREGTRRLNKLLGSVAAWLPAGFSPDMAQQFGELLKLGIAEVRMESGCPPIEADPGVEHEPGDEAAAGEEEWVDEEAAAADDDGLEARAADRAGAGIGPGSIPGRYTYGRRDPDDVSETDEEDDGEGEGEDSEGAGVAQRRPQRRAAAQRSLHVLSGLREDEGEDDDPYEQYG